MKLARCPHCATTFRATEEQLEQRAGKVRCGKCRRVFNALENLLDDERAPHDQGPAERAADEVAAPPHEQSIRPAAAAPAAAPASPAAPLEKAPDLPEWPGETPGTDLPSEESREKFEATSAASSDAHPPGATRRESETLTEGQREAAQAARLNAARDTRQLPGYKWAEGTLSAPDTHFEEPKGAPWLLIVVACVLSLMLIAQLAHHFRTELGAHWPGVRPWLEEACVSLNCTVPYPRNADLISLEGSELSIDETRGNLLVLNFTLKNKADFAQDYPAVELTLTNVQNNIVVRRILPPAEYLPPNLESTPAFAAGGEIAARLWIDASDTGAVGYSLYVFYP